MQLNKLKTDGYLMIKLEYNYNIILAYKYNNMFYLVFNDTIEIITDSKNRISDNIKFYATNNIF